MNFTVIPFMLLEVQKSWHGWQTLGYYGIIVVIVPMIAFRAGLGKALDQLSGVAEKKKRDKSLHAKKELGNGNHQIPDVDIVEDEAMKMSSEAHDTVQHHIKEMKKDL